MIIIFMIILYYLRFSSMILANPFRRSRSIQGGGRSATSRMTRALDGHAFGWVVTPNDSDDYIKVHIYIHIFLIYHY